MDDQVPPSLLLLSRAMFFPEELTFEERLRSVLSSLPEGFFVIQNVFLVEKWIFFVF
jgi:hypothetical protein